MRERERESEKYLRALAASQSLSCCGLGSGVPCVGVATYSLGWSASSSSCHSVSMAPYGSSPCCVQWVTGGCLSNGEAADLVANR
uniref:Uncharacterized protein n=1 Tax=Fagus sylvatica TaxID=28930 RepID=A0A2N9E163_FAGSY